LNTRILRVEEEHSIYPIHLPKVGLNCRTAPTLSSFLLIIQFATRPSLEMEKKLSSLAKSSSCQYTCHTGSVCFPVLMLDLMDE
jgi:hypothetical protein